MAKKYTVTASVNGGSAATHDVICKNDETIGDKGWLWRMHQAFGGSSGEAADTYAISSITGPTSIADPMGGFSAIPGTILLTVSLGQISLAFID